MSRLDPSRRGDARNARILADACRIAYLNPPAGPDAFREALGLEADLIAGDNTQVYVATDEANIVVAFRGSQAPATLDGLKDWLLTNANNSMALPEGRAGTDFAAAGVGARYHRGFLSALDMIWEPLLASVNAAVERAERPVWVTGHSLGGSLALLAAWRLGRHFVEVHEIVTFGAPMVGNDRAADAFNREFAGKIFRNIDPEDPVPLLPSVSLVANIYSHCNDEVALGEASAGSVLDMLKAVAGPAATLLDAVSADVVWRAVQGRIAAHMIGHYLQRISAKLGGPG